MIISEQSPVAVQEEDLWSSEQEKWINQALVGPPAEREAAVRELAGYETIASVAALMDALINDSEAGVRRAAAQSLGVVGDPATFEILWRSVEADGEESVRDAARAAAQKIAESYDLHKPQVAKFPPMNQGKMELGEYLEDLRLGGTSVRQKAAKKLRDHAGTQAVAALINALINDPDAKVREEAAESLGKMADRMALDFLKAARESDSEKDVREEAEEAVEDIYDAAFKSSDSGLWG